MKTKNRVFCCYSILLKDFLYKHGKQYDLCALNPNNKNMFWAYIRDEELDKLLTEWSNRKG